MLPVGLWYFSSPSTTRNSTMQISDDYTAIIESNIAKPDYKKRTCTVELLSDEPFSCELGKRCSKISISSSGQTNYFVYLIDEDRICEIGSNTSSDLTSSDIQNYNNGNFWARQS